MTTGPGAKPPSDTPQRVVVRADARANADSDSAVLGATDAAVASAATAQVPAFAPAGELIGATLAERYLVTRKIGQGGMGAVYEATHTLIGKRVAVKVLLEKYAQREAIVARLKQEAQLASSVGNEHIIDITDFGTTDDGRTFVVMEYLDGESLAECLARETRLPEQRILKIAAQAASALAAAHAKGIVHRDIKPENLFLLRRRDQDFVKVVDFGISKSLRASNDEEQPRLTQTGMVLGTPLYMSPEQARGDDALDARVDVYALGVIMYEASTGRVPFVGNNYLSVISQVLNQTPTPVREIRPELSEEFEAVVARAMEKVRTERYGSATEMLGDITALLEDPTHSTERARITGPRKRAPRGDRSASRYLIWVSGVAVIVAAVAFTVKSMMTGAAPPAAIPDAGVAHVAPDAAVAVAPPADAAPPPAPEVEVVEMTILTEPPGATILQEGVLVSGIDGEQVTPMKIRVVKKDKDIQFVAQLAGYEEKRFEKNAYLLDPKTPVRIPLERAKRPNPTYTVPRPAPGPGTGSAARPGTAGGELGGYPGAAPKQ